MSRASCISLVPSHKKQLIFIPMLLFVSPVLCFSNVDGLGTNVWCLELWRIYSLRATASDQTLKMPSVFRASLCLVLFLLLLLVLLFFSLLSVRWLLLA